MLNKKYFIYLKLYIYLISNYDIKNIAIKTLYILQ